MLITFLGTVINEKKEQSIREGSFFSEFPKIPLSAFVR
jgi:hypothetical protein